MLNSWFFYVILFFRIRPKYFFKMTNYSFPRNEKLKSRKVITQLFEEGNAEYFFPIKLLWISGEENQDLIVKAGFSVPKRSFKRAVDRNLLKRRMREAYRLNKSELLGIAQQKELQISLFFIYSTNTIYDYKQIEVSISRHLNGLLAKL